MSLNRNDFDSAVSPTSFASQWHSFVKRDDQLVVYHQRTYQLAHDGGPRDPRCLALKSIYGQLSPGFHTLEELLAAEGVKVQTVPGQTRAALRLEMAVSMLRHLRDQYAIDSAICSPPL